MLKSIKKPPYHNQAKSIITNESIQKDSYKFVNLLGYAILVFMVIDYVYLLISPQFFNPNWELTTMGKIIETVYVTLLGFMLVFFRPQKQRIKQGELRILSWLSRLALFLGILCFLFAPLLISNSLRINNANQAKINLQLENQNQQLQQFTLQLDNVNEEQIRNIWARNQQNSSPNTNLSAEEQKQQILSKVNSVKQKSTIQLQKKLNSNKHFLFKMTLKWVFGTIIAGTSFLAIWKCTQWSRVVRAVEQEL